MINSNIFKINPMIYIGKICISISAGVIIYFRYPFFGFPSILVSCLLIILLCAIALILFPAKGSKTIVLYSFLPLILFGFWLFTDSIFDAFDWSAIIFHLRTGFGDTKGVDVYYQMGVVFTLSIFLLALGMLILKNYSSFFKYLDIVAAICLVVFNPALITLANGAFKIDKQSNALLENYIEPEISLKGGQTPYNFIHVFLESAERTYFDEEAFGPIASPLKELETKGFSAQHLLQAKDTGWTAAGIVAAHCGVPLSSYGMLSLNHFSLTNEFLTNAICLGDLLAEHGYELSNIQGVDVNFAGQINLFEKHGFKNVFGHHELMKLYPERKPGNKDRSSDDWGFTDDMVFDAGMDVLVKAQAKNKPFGIILQAMGGHSPSGYLAAKCEARPELQPINYSILKANYCTNLLAKEFLEKAREQGLLDNTIVIVQSDHLSTKSEVSSFLKERERTNFFTIFGPNVPVRQTVMPASMMDAFPTILEALGFNLTNRKAGLGVSLFSAAKTLTDIHGLPKFDEMIAEDNMLVPILWGHNPKSGILTGAISQ